MPHTFLVPGYGAQGASGSDLKGYFDKDGRGCIVNSSELLQHIRGKIRRS